MNSLIIQNNCAFLDLRKAFDCVHRNSLWVKLVSNRLSKNMYNIKHSMYESVKYLVKNYNISSAVFSSLIGVRQGDPL